MPAVALALKTARGIPPRRADLAGEGAAQPFLLAEAAFGSDPFDRNIGLFEDARTASTRILSTMRAGVMPMVPT